MTTYGEIFNKLTERVRLVNRRVYGQCYGTPDYFNNLRLAIHREFDAFARDMNIRPEQRRELRKLLKTHWERYHYVTLLEPLFLTIPQEFNVRGEWTSEDVK